MLYVWYPKNRKDLNVIHEENTCLIIRMEHTCLIIRMEHPRNYKIC